VVVVGVVSLDSLVDVSEGLVDGEGFVVSEVFVSEVLIVEGAGLDGLGAVLPPPQPWAFPLSLSLPQLPLSGFPPSPGFSVGVSLVSVFLPVLGSFEPPVPSASPFGPLP
jgi:hypothetical protein